MRHEHTQHVLSTEPITHVPLSELEHHPCHPSYDPHYDWAKLRAGRDAEALPPISCYRGDDDRLMIDDGRHRHALAVASGAETVAAVVFRSLVHSVRSHEYAVSSKGERERMDRQVQAAKHWLKEAASGRARLTKADRDSYLMILAGVGE